MLKAHGRWSLTLGFQAASGPSNSQAVKWDDIYSSRRLCGLNELVTANGQLSLGMPEEQPFESTHKDRTLFFVYFLFQWSITVYHSGV